MLRMKASIYFFLPLKDLFANKEKVYFEMKLKKKTERYTVVAQRDFLMLKTDNLCRIYC